MELSASFTSDFGPQGFHFFGLPAEIRRKIYELALCVKRTIDLDPANPRCIAPRLDLLLTSRRVHQEAYAIFYGSHTFRIFPTHGRFFGDKIKPLISRLPPHYRAAITSLELRLGPGWNKPPKSWTVDQRLGLGDAVFVRKLKIFVECDPSHDFFRGFRMVEPSFTDIAEAWLQGLISTIPSVETIQFDGYSFVSKSDPLMSRLLQVAKAKKKRITWGSEAAWEDDY
ncbi:hypothetical protein MMC16_005756 [Acarospora aff. strigata]|nr:hypothetical protein [Acarospora aff. strigata]